MPPTCLRSVSGQGVIGGAAFLLSAALLREAWRRCLGKDGIRALPHAFACADLAKALGWLARLGWDLEAVSQVGLTPLHVAVSQGRLGAARALISSGADVHASDESGHTAVIMAAAFGHLQVLTLLLECSGDPSAANCKGGTPLHFAAAKGHLAAVKCLLGAGAYVDSTDAAGATPLVIAINESQPGDVAQLMDTLLAGRADPELGASRVGKSALMQAAARDDSAAVQALLRGGASATRCDTFGQTALHWACRECCLSAAMAIVEAGRGEGLLAQDNDGSYALTFLAEHLARGDLGALGLLRAMLAAEPLLAGARDFGDSTPLITVMAAARRGGGGDGAVPAIELLVGAGADPSCEEESGWTAAHYATSEPLRAALGASPSFWAAFDPAKPRDDSNRKYLARRGGHHRIPIAEREDVLRGSWSLEEIARRISEGRSNSVILLFGAGVSTSAGIPDFRSSTGVWANETTGRLFSPEMWQTDGAAAWRTMLELLGRSSGTPKPCAGQRFAKLLEERGLLLRCYTQNVDGLEAEAGVSAERLVLCHGDASRAICTSCPWRADEPAQALGCGAPGPEPPRCPACGAPLRPDVVFFGEPLPEGFLDVADSDFAECDLLIVAGTSLTVYPVAGLVKQVGALCPRLLINRVRVGHWASTEPPSASGPAYRDVCWEGDVDEGFRELASLLGWTLDAASTARG